VALPSTVTIASAAVVVTAGIGLAAWAAADSTDDTQSGIPITTVVDAGTTDKTSPNRSEHPHHKAPHKPRHHRSAVPKTLVEVYNNSGISGVASQTATKLEGAGWNVAVTDNWYGDIPASTVYYPPSYRTDAKRLAKLLGISRLHPAVSPMQFGRLTVILTDAPAG
jgi:hypothetical protein